jgi:hypothetical protein
MELTLTQARIDEILDGMMLVAKQQRTQIPYSKVDAFAQVLMFLGPNLEVATYPAIWRNEKEKYALMRAVSEAAKKTLAQAVILISDVRWVENSRAEKILGLPPLAEVGVEEWQTLYKREITKRYGGYLGKAPPELYSEAIMAIMKGPRLNGVPTRMAVYEKGENDSIRWLPKHPESEGITHKFNLLPDWWC